MLPIGSSMSVLEVGRDDLVEVNRHTESVANDIMNDRLEGKLDSEVSSKVPPSGFLRGAVAT